MKRLRILFIDIDGTLVDYQDRLPRSAAEAVREARARGHRVYACTGRPLAQIRPELRDLGFDGYLAGGGNYVEDAGQVLSYNPLPRDIERKIVDWLLSRDIPFYIEANSGLFTSPDFETRALAHLTAYARHNGKTEEIRSVDDAISGFTHGHSLYVDDANKISFTLTKPQVLDELRHAFPDLRVATWGGRGDVAFFGEIGVQTNKGESVRILLDHLEADRRDAIGFGDTLADVPMLHACGLGVAMGNSTADVRVAADYVTGDVEQNGLRDAFVHLGLIDGPQGTDSEQR